jgi:hypothetical protein
VPVLEPALAIVIMLVFGFVNGVYVQEHLNRIWDRAAGTAPVTAPPLPPAP